MNSIKVYKNGGPEELVLSDVPVKEPTPGELLVDVEAAGVNYVDVYQRVGIYDLPKPYTPGFEGVGRVLKAAGSFAEGDRVAWINVLGSYSQQVSIPFESAIRIPKTFTVDQSLLFQGVTAQYLIKEYTDIKPDDFALVHAAAGGVGQLLVQWLKHLGAVVIATASSSSKLETARSLGADHLINYTETDFVSVVREVTLGKGVNVAFDAVGKATLEKTVASLAIRGTAVTYGSASGVPPAIEASKLIANATRLAGASIFPHIADPNELQERAGVVIKAIEERWLKIGYGTSYPLANAPKAHQDIESRRTEGKLYLLPQA